MRKLFVFSLSILILLSLALASLPARAQSSVPAWQPNVSYQVGAQVTYQDASHPNHLYQCLQAHTSQVGWEPPYTPALWSDLGPYSGGSATNTPVPATNTSAAPTATKAPATATPVQPTATPSSGNGSPYGGTPAAIPGTIQAENYNTGGQNVAYSDTTTGNSGNAYRTEDVDIEATTDTGAGYNVGWIATGEWLKYTVNVQTSGTYTASFRVASTSSTGQLHLEVDGTNVTGTLAVPNTGAWQTWTTITKSGISLSAGQHIVRVYFDATGLNLNWFSFAASATPTNTPVPPSATPSSGNGSPYGGTPAAIPGTIQAENYNTGGQNVAYSDTTTGNSGNAYRTDDVDIEATTDTGAGYNVGWIATGEWLKYTVNVQTSGTYTASFRVASTSSTSQLHLEVDGTNVTGTLAVPNTGAWQTWTTITKSGISLSAGQHVLRVYFDATGLNLNWFSLSTGTPPTNTPVPTFQPPTNTPVATATSGPSGWPANHVYAPYIDVSLRSDLVSIANTSGSKYFTLAFIIDAGSSCTAEWGGTSNTMSSSFLVSEINNLRAAGGNVIVSFGGAAGNELALDCGSVSALQAQYQAVITKYNLNRIDFDVEGSAISNTTANDRRNKAIKNLQAANPGLMVSYTLAVDTSGLPGEQISLLNNAVSNGVNVSIVNIMAMDYANDSRDMGSAATQAATSTFNQLKSVFTGKTDAQIYHMIGITPMIGINDTQPETFTLSNAQTVLSYSQQHNTGLIAMWSMNRDHGCSTLSDTCSGVSESDYGFSSIWKAFNQ